MERATMTILIPVKEYAAKHFFSVSCIRKQIKQKKLKAKKIKGKVFVCIN
jgi:hypothetical protein